MCKISLIFALINFIFLKDTVYLIDIKHPIHKHQDGSEHKTRRLYSRKKVNGFYNYVPACWQCVNCGQLI